MNILTDILSLFKRRKISSILDPNDVVVVGKNETPDMEGIASPVPYKRVELVRIKDLITSQDLEFENLPVQDPVIDAGCFRDKTTDPVTGQGIVNFRRFKALSLNLSITENGDFIDFDCAAEANTASNVGAGMGLFKQKVGEDLEFKSITSVDGTVNIVDNGDTIDLAADTITDVITDGTSITGDGTQAFPLTATSTGSDGNQLISGGASYSGTGMVFNVSVLNYMIGGIQYTTAATDVTLLVGDPSNPRFDAIVASIDANDDPIVEVIQGVPASTPSTPTIGPEQVLVQYVLVGQNATNPTIQTEYIYRNDQSSDWNGTAPIINLNPSFSCPTGVLSSANFTSSTPSPVAGGACLLANVGRYINQARGLGVKFSSPSPVSRADYTVLSFYVNFPSPGFTQQGMGKLRCTLHSEPVWYPTVGYQNYYLGWVEVGNFCDLNLTDTWQLVNIPTSSFTQNSNLTTIGGIHFISHPNPCTQVFFALDEIKLQTGFGPSTNIATIDILENDTLVGSTAKLNFKNSTNIACNVTEDPTTDVITVESRINDNIFTITDPGSGTITFDGNTNGYVQEITLSASAAYTLDIDLTNVNVGGTYMLVVTQEGTTGNATMAFTSNFQWSGGTAPVLTATAGAKDVLSFVCVEDPSTGQAVFIGVPTLNVQ